MSIIRWFKELKMNKVERLNYEANLLLDFYIIKVLKDSWSNFHNPRVAGKYKMRCLDLVDRYGYKQAKRIIEKTKSIKH